MGYRTNRPKVLVLLIGRRTFGVAFVYGGQELSPKFLIGLLAAIAVVAGAVLLGTSVSVEQGPFSTISCGSALSPSGDAEYRDDVNALVRGRTELAGECEDKLSSRKTLGGVLVIAGLIAGAGVVFVRTTPRGANLST